MCIFVLITTLLSRYDYRTHFTTIALRQRDSMCLKPYGWWLTEPQSHGWQCDLFLSSFALPANTQTTSVHELDTGSATVVGLLGTFYVWARVFNEVVFIALQRGNRRRVVDRFRDSHRLYISMSPSWRAHCQGWGSHPGSFLNSHGTSKKGLCGPWFFHLPGLIQTNVE